LGRVYAFGLGAYGQLGAGETKSCNSPVVAKGPWMGSSSTSLGNEMLVTKVVAGGDHCFVICAKADVSVE
jgi:alpha-tubulin suppressor-like RCC1 family protein